MMDSGTVSEAITSVKMSGKRSRSLIIITGTGLWDMHLSSHDCAILNIVDSKEGREMIANLHCWSCAMVQY